MFTRWNSRKESEKRFRISSQTKVVRWNLQRLKNQVDGNLKTHQEGSTWVQWMTSMRLKDTTWQAFNLTVIVRSNNKKKTLSVWSCLIDSKKTKRKQFGTSATCKKSLKRATSFAEALKNGADFFLRLKNDHQRKSHAVPSYLFLKSSINEP